MEANVQLENLRRGRELPVLRRRAAHAVGVALAEGLVAPVEQFAEGLALASRASDTFSAGYEQALLDLLAGVADGLENPRVAARRLPPAEKRHWRPLLRHLVDRPSTPTELAERLDAPLDRISKTLSELRGLQWVTHADSGADAVVSPESGRVDARRRHYAITGAGRVAFRALREAGPEASTAKRLLALTRSLLVRDSVRHREIDELILDAGGADTPAGDAVISFVQGLKDEALVCDDGARYSATRERGLAPLLADAKSREFAAGLMTRAAKVEAELVVLRTDNALALRASLPAEADQVDVLPADQGLLENVVGLGVDAPAPPRRYILVYDSVARRKHDESRPEGHEIVKSAAAIHYLNTSTAGSPCADTGLIPGLFGEATPPEARA